jgi:hypothetical protein
MHQSALEWSKVDGLVSGEVFGVLQEIALIEAHFITTKMPHAAGMCHVRFISLCVANSLPANSQCTSRCNRTLSERFEGSRVFLHFSRVLCSMLYGVRRLSCRFVLAAQHLFRLISFCHDAHPNKHHHYNEQIEIHEIFSSLIVYLLDSSIAGVLLGACTHCSDQLRRTLTHD